MILDFGYKVQYVERQTCFYVFLKYIYEYFFIDLEIWVQPARRKCAWHEVKGGDGGAVRPAVIRSGQQQGADITSHGAAAPGNRGSKDGAYRGQRSRMIQMEWKWLIQQGHGDKFWVKIDNTFDYSV